MSGISHSAPNQKELLKAWWQAARPPFYIATLVPVFLGFIEAGKDTQLWETSKLLCVMFVCFLLHLSANLGNDLFDHWQGVDAGPNIGGSRVIQERKITPRTITRVLLAIYALVCIISAVGIHYYQRPLLWTVVLFAMFSSLFYVAPPIKYGHRALGEVFVFLNMGLGMTAGAYYAFTGAVSHNILLLSIPVGLMVAGILYFQSLPEIETDKAVGKNTLANVLGPKKATTVSILWWPAIWLCMVALWLQGVCSWFVVIGIVCSIPLHIKACAHVRQAAADWLGLDKHGHLVRKMYALCGGSLIIGILTT